MKKTFDSDDDDEDLDKPSSLLQTQRFTKTGTIGTKDFRITQTKPKHKEVSSLNINLNQMSDDDDSLNDSDDDSNTKTARSTSSATTSQLTPKPKERLFIKKDGEKPKIKPRHIDIDDDERNVFGRTTIKSSPRQQILSLREEEERDQSFIHGFSNEKKRQSPTDMFSIDHKTDFRKNPIKSSHKHEIEERSDSDDDDDDRSNKQSKLNDFRKSRHSPTNNDQLESTRHSHRSKEGSDQSDNDDHHHLNRHSQRQEFTKHRQSNHDLIPTSPKDTDLHGIQHQSSTSRPSSAGKKEIESTRRSSFCEDQNTVIPPLTNQKSQSQPTSAKSNTNRQQTQSAIDIVTSANAPPALDPLTSNNEALAAALQPPSSPPLPPPRPSARLPPKPKSSSHHTTSGGIGKKEKFKVPSRYKEITSRVDTGREPVSTMDLTRSVERALNKALKTQTLPRPSSARSRKQSANSNNNERQRRRSSSAYEHVGPRVNTNLSINFDELNTSRMRADSSQAIKDSVYLEWLKTKEEQKQLEKKELKQWQDEKTKRIDKSTIERKIYQDAQNLERWRQEREEQIKKRKQEELKLQREHEENKKREQQQKRKDAKDGFVDWKAKKDEELKQKIEDEHSKKTEIEQRQEEKQKKVLEAEKAYERWMNKKTEQIKKTQDNKKTTRTDQFKKIRENEETKFVSAQEAYEKWLKEKEKYEIEEKMNTQRRNSLSAKQQQAPFLPGGSQKNTGRVRHVVW